MYTNTNNTLHIANTNSLEIRAVAFIANHFILFVSFVSLTRSINCFAGYSLTS
ncbi:unnamed protein product [Arabidopsis halleri]